MKHSSKPGDKQVSNASESVHPSYDEMVSGLLAHMRNTNLTSAEAETQKLVGALAQISATYGDVLPNIKCTESRCAIFVTNEGKIENLNDAARAEFNAQPGKAIQTLMLTPANIFSQIDGGNASLIKLVDRCNRTVVMVGIKEEDTSRLVLVEADHGWPAGFDERLRSSYELTQRECRVLQHICSGSTSAEIAQISARKIGTVRQQIKSILTKLEVNSQAQAVALVTSILVTIMGLNPLEHPTNRSNLHSTLIGANGSIGYSRFGLQGALPVLFFHGALFGIASNGRDYEIARTIGLDIWAPHRPGYGQTQIAENTDDIIDRAMENALKVMDRNGVSRVVLLAHDVGCAYAFHFAAHYSERVAGLVCGATTPPMRNWEQTNHMPVRHRVNAWAAQQLPQVMDGMISLGLAHIGRKGLHVIPEYVFADSNYDRETWQKPEYISSIEKSFALVQQQQGTGFKFDMHLTNEDWSDIVEKVECPVVLMHGDQNKTVNKNAVIALGALIKNANIQIVEDAGHTMALTHSANILREVSRLGILARI